MPFREDDEAAHARVDALAQEVQDLKEERDRLLAEREAAGKQEREAGGAKWKKEKKAKEKKERNEKKKPPATPADDASAERAGKWAGWIVGGVCGAALLGAIVVGVVQGRRADRTRKAYDAAVAQETATKQRWAAILDTEPCSRRIRLDEIYARPAMREEGMRRSGYNASQFIGSLASNCLDGPARLLKDPATTAPVKAALAAWLGAETGLAAPVKELAAYLKAEDWKEDDFRRASTLRPPLEAALLRRDEALAVVRRDALPALRDDLRARSAAEEAMHGKDELVWRTEIGLLFWDVQEAATDLAEGHASAAAVHDAVSKLLAETTKAPLEVRRQVRTLDWLTGPIMSGTVLGGDELWNLAWVSADHLLGAMRETVPGLPALPPRPSRDD